MTRELRGKNCLGEAPEGGIYGCQKIYNDEIFDPQRSDKESGQQKRQSHRMDVVVPEL